MGLNNFLMPKAAEAFATQGVRALGGVLRMAMLCSVVVLGSLCVLAFFAGDFLGGIAFGREYADTGLLITMLALATFTDALGLTATTGLWAVDRPAAGVVGDVVNWPSRSAWRCGWCFPWGPWESPSPWWPAGRPAPPCGWITLWRLMAAGKLTGFVSMKMNRSVYPSCRAVARQSAVAVAGNRAAGRRLLLRGP